MLKPHTFIFKTVCIKLNSETHKKWTVSRKMVVTFHRSKGLDNYECDPRKIYKMSKATT